MTTVSTKQELISAIERREKQIIATGEIAASIRRKVKVKKGAKVGGLVLAIGGLLAIPFTGGTSAGLTAAGMALTVGTVTVRLLNLQSFAASFWHTRQLERARWSLCQMAT